ncbi:MAG: RNA-binding S4 domain-containing protein [Flavobacteriaceae bacterium]
MRVDKYLWCIRFYKSRSLAAQACKKGQVRIDGKSLKSSREVYGGDQLQIRKNQMEHVIQILGLPSSRLGAKLVEQYAKDITPDEVREARDQIAQQQAMSRVDGGGRPRKKNRRDLLDFLEDNEA